MDIEQYWAGFFGVRPAIFNNKEICLVPHAALSDYWGLWIFSKKNSIIISSPAAFLPVCQKLIEKVTADRLKDIETVRELFEQHAERLIGPAFHGSLNANDFSPFEEHAGREISFDETQTINDGTDSTGWDDSGSGQEKMHYYGVYLEGELAAVSNYSINEKILAFPGVYTHPHFRGRGLSKTALSLAFKASLGEGLLMDYQTHCSNIASIRTAERLGVKEFARHIAIRLKGKDSNF